MTVLQLRDARLVGELEQTSVGCGSQMQILSAGLARIRGVKPAGAVILLGRGLAWVSERQQERGSCAWAQVCGMKERGSRHQTNRIEHGAEASLLTSGRVRPILVCAGT